VDASERFGVPRSRLNSIASQAGVPANLRRAASTGILPRHTVSREVARDARTNARLLEVELKREQDDRLEAFRSVEPSTINP
jgi:hypothetical protein